MLSRNRAMLCMVLPALSLVLFPRAIFSAPAVQNSDAVPFTISRLRQGMAVEIRDKQGKILLCGELVYQRLDSGRLHASVRTHSPLMPDCPKDGEVKTAEITLDKIEFVEIITPDDEYYIYETGKWRNAVWLKPVRRGYAAFEDSTGAPVLWRRYSRPARVIPGVFWPEVRAAAGPWSMTRTGDSGVAAAVALDFKVHRALYPLQLFFESMFASRFRNGNSDLLSAARFAVFHGGLSYAFWQRPAFSLAATLSGGVVYYIFDEATGAGNGLRPVAGGGLIFAWHFFKNNRDAHKLSFILQPQALVVINRDETQVPQLPFLFELRAGVQYGY